MAGPLAVASSYGQIFHNSVMYAGGGIKSNLLSPLVKEIVKPLFKGIANACGAPNDLVNTIRNFGHLANRLLNSGHLFVTLFNYFLVALFVAAVVVLVVELYYFFLAKHNYMEHEKMRMAAQVHTNNRPVEKPRNIGLAAKEIFQDNREIFQDKKNKVQKRKMNTNA
jgi:large-conductance mechanosensitive channel